MHKLSIDFKEFPTKALLLNFLITRLEEMYSPNYDALIDSLTSYDTPLLFEFKNIKCFENEKDLLEVFDIIHKENQLISYIIQE